VGDANVPGAPTSNADVVSHEFAHAVIGGLNKDFDAAVAASVKADPRLSRTKQNGALSEGLADAVAGAWANAGPTPEPTGNAWIIGDAPPALVSDYRRDFRTGLQFSHLQRDFSIRDGQGQVIGDDFQERGRPYAQFFYRLSQKPPFNQDPAKLLRLVLRTVQDLDDANNDGYDVNDFLAAVRSATRGDTTQLAAISAASSEMGIAPPPSTPPPTRARPDAPRGLSLTRVIGCQFDAPTGIFGLVVDFGWQPTLNANDYEVFARFNGAVEENLGKVPSTTARVITGGLTDFTVRACNETGCGPLSPENVFVDGLSCSF
jgi:hypothetical protein